jgi:hypothetical protein
MTSRVTHEPHLPATFFFFFNTHLRIHSDRCSKGHFGTVSAKIIENRLILGPPKTNQTDILHIIQVTSQMLRRLLDDAVH